MGQNHLRFGLNEKEVLSPSYYAKKCPEAEGIIQQKVKQWFLKDSTMAASLIRLHFHDCLVRGCDASILLNHRGSERRATESKTLRGFEVIDEIKQEIERKCPKMVSCADILTAAARDATVIIGGPFWELSYGRKDGTISVAKEASLVPQGNENVTQLINIFQEIGLNILDLVVLSGSHTIGRSTCRSILHRILPNSGGELDRNYKKNLTRSCKWSTDYVNLDSVTPKKFDNQYYMNLEKKMGLLSTDEALFMDPRTSPFVSAMATQNLDLFYTQFAVSMVKLANVVLPSKYPKEVRLNCNIVNS
ncbi:peroxidase 7-like [Euphorbia lathyris]|uniref:peroxidase 7-like n=1 Tax=Euphorbia lathyris TaxID=212925 RepID=UPI0033132028